MTQNSKYEVRKFGPTTLRRDYSISQKNSILLTFGNAKSISWKIY